MTSVNTKALKDFGSCALRINAQFENPIDPLSVIESASSNDGADYAGIIRSKKGFMRLAIDEHRGVIIALAAKVADVLKGKTPSEDAIKRMYGIAARKVRHGDHILPPDFANFFIEQKQEFDQEIITHSRQRFRFYGVRIGEHEIFSNPNVAYVIENQGNKKYNVRFVAPLETNPEDFSPKGVKKRWSGTLMQKTIIEDVSRAEAIQAFVKHRQSLTSKFWDHVNIYKGEGPGFNTARTATLAGNYLANRAPTLALGTFIAGGFISLKEGKLVSLLLAFAVAHSVSEVTGHSIMNKTSNYFERRKQRQKVENIDNFSEDENRIAFYLSQESNNLLKPWPHLDPERFRAENLRYLTMDELEHLVNKIGVIDSGLRPASLRGLAENGHERGFTYDIVFPSPNTRIEVGLNGLIVLKHATSRGEQHLFARFRGDASVSDATRLPDEYVTQAGSGGQIQRIITQVEDPDSIGYEPVTYEQMMEIIEPTLYETASTRDNYILTIAEQFKKQGLAYIEGLFNPAATPETGTKASIDLYMSGNMPLLPSEYAIL